MMHPCGGENSSSGGNNEIQSDQLCENKQTSCKNDNHESNNIDTCTVQNLSTKPSDEKDRSETRGRKMTIVNFLPTDCKLCGQNFTSDKALGYHIRDVHVVGKKDEKKVCHRLISMEKNEDSHQCDIYYYYCCWWLPLQSFDLIWPSKWIFFTINSLNWWSHFSHQGWRE